PPWSSLWRRHRARRTHAGYERQRLLPNPPSRFLCSLHFPWFLQIANDVATIALKSRRSGLARTEFEYVIPYSAAEEMLRIMCEGNVLDKARHFVSHAGNTWQVDVYEGLLDGVVLAEIELTGGNFLGFVQLACLVLLFRRF